MERDRRPDVTLATCQAIAVDFETDGLTAMVLWRNTDQIVHKRQGADPLSFTQQPVSQVR